MLIPKELIRTACALAITLLLVTSATANPNFSGMWARDTSRSDAFTAVIAPLIAAKQNSPGNNFLLRINHHNKHLQVAVEQDGKGPAVEEYDLGRGWHNNLDPNLERQFGGTRYRSNWRKDVFVLEKHARFPGNFRDSDGYMEQQWDLSPGGDVLTITTNTDGFTTREVFHRK